MAVEEKWKANLEKVAFMKQFPGLLGNWEALAGKTIKAVIPLKGKQGNRCAGVHRWYLYHLATDGVGTIRVGRGLGGSTSAP